MFNKVITFLISTFPFNKIYTLFLLFGKYPSAVFLVVVNCIPIFGVFYFDWQMGSILIMYWSENIVIGIFNILRMINAQPSKKLVRIHTMLFFTVHYGIFTLAHGMFVLFLAFNVFSNDNKDSEITLNHLNLILNSVIGFILLFVSHGFSYVFNYLLRKEYL